MSNDTFSINLFMHLITYFEALEKTWKKNLIFFFRKALPTAYSSLMIYF